MLQVHAAYRQHKPAWKTENEALEEEIPIKRIVNFGQSIKKIEQSFKTLQKDGKKNGKFSTLNQTKGLKKKTGSCYNTSPEHGCHESRYTRKALKDNQAPLNGSDLRRFTKKNT